MTRNVVATRNAAAAPNQAKPRSKAAAQPYTPPFTAESISKSLGGLKQTAAKAARAAVTKSESLAKKAAGTVGRASERRTRRTARPVDDGQAQPTENPARQTARQRQQQRAHPESSRASKPPRTAAGAAKPRATTERSRATTERSRATTERSRATIERPRAAGAAEPRKTARRTASRTASASSHPPVVARRGMDWATYETGRGGKSAHGRGATRRRYDIALDIPGAELRLPALPTVHLGWRAVSGLMFVMMLACLFFLWNSPAFRVNTVAAEGLQRLTVGDLNAVLGLFDRSIFTIDPAEVELALEQAFPEFSSISVRLGLPANVRISVVERQPVLAWLQEGRELWIDADGVAFLPRGNPLSPLVRIEARSAPPGFDPAAVLEPGFGSLPYMMPQPAGEAGEMALPQRQNRIEPTLVANILAIGPQVPADTLLVYDAEHGLGWNDPRGWDVYFGAQIAAAGEGQPGDISTRLLVYQALVERLEADGVQPAFISVEFLHAPYYGAAP